MQLAAVVFPEEEYQREKSADSLAETCCKSGAYDSQLEYRDKQKIQQHICAASGDYHNKPQLRAFRSDQETLEHILEHEHRVEYQAGARVCHAIIKHFDVRAEKQRHLIRENNAQH